MTAFRVPFTAAQPQRFSIELSGTTYILVARWSDPSDCWILDIYDALSVPVLLGTPLVPGADLLEQFEYLAIGGALVVETSSDINAVPTYLNLGDVGNLYYVVADV